MNHLNRSIATLALCAISAFSSAAVAQSHVVATPKVVPDFSVFLDPPTGFVFVKLPSGWKFVGKVDPKDVARSPSGVLTSLLDPADEAGVPGRVALQPAK